MNFFLRYHGSPRKIISDRICKFINEFRTTLYKFCGIKIKLNIAYHSRTNGQTEQTNRTLKDMLRMYVTTSKGVLLAESDKILKMDI